MRLVAVLLFQSLELKQLAYQSLDFKRVSRVDVSPGLRASTDLSVAKRGKLIGRFFGVYLLWNDGVVILGA
jgi:hypothetical protein